MTEVVITNNTLVLSAEIKEQIKAVSKAKKEADRAEKELKDALMKAMEMNGVLKYESDDMLITYVQGTYKEQLDSKRLKAEKEELYNEYTKFVKVSPSVRITLRD